MVVCTWNPRAGKAKTGRSLWLTGQPAETNLKALDLRETLSQKTRVVTEE